MTDLNVKKEYLNLIYADCGKGSAGEKIKELVTVPGTQYLIFGVILGVFPLLAQLGILTSSFVFAMGNTMIYAIMAIGFCLLMGYSGLASLGTAGFVGIGAYIAYYFMQVYGAPFGIAFIVTVMISLFSGVLVGFISLRIEGIYLAILTLGLSEILRNTFISLKSSIKLDMSKVRLFGVKIGEEQVYSVDSGRQGCDGIRSQCLRCGGIGANGSSARLSRSGSIPLSTHGGTDAVCAGAVSRSWRPVRGAADLRQRPRLYVGSRGSGGGSAAAIYSLNTGGIHMLFEKTAIVTGAASGIGYAVAQALRQEGAQVVMADVNEALLIESARELGGVPFVGNLTRREDCRRLVEFTVERFGGVDILANVAGVQHVCPIEEFPEDKWDFIISLMLTAPFLLTRYCWPYMKEKGWGRIINMSSIHGLVASEFKSAYVSAKHGLVGFTKTAAMEGGPQGITCNAICPAYVMTPLVEKQIAAQAQTHGIPEEKVISDIMLSKAAIKKMVPAENIGAIVKFLCSDAAASITGIALPIDGGWTAN